MLAIVASRVKTLDPEYPDLGRLQGFKRFVFAHTHRTLHATRPMLQMLSAEGIEMMLLKTAARLTDDPSFAAERYMADVDVLVRLEDWGRACAIAEREEWRFNYPAEPMAEGRFADWYPFRHSIDFMDGTDPATCFGRLDLHHHILHTCRSPDDDLAFWKRARPARLFDLDVLVPDPTDQLLITLAHGMRRARHRNATTDWGVDAATLIRGNKIRWPRLIKDARRRRTEAPVAASLLVLKEMLGVRVPADVLEQLSTNVDAVSQAELGFLANASYRTIKMQYSEAARDGLVARAKAYVKRAKVPSDVPLRLSYPRIQLPGSIGTDPILFDLPANLSRGEKPVLDISVSVRKTQPKWAVALDCPMTTLAIIPLDMPLMVPGSTTISTSIPIPAELFVAMRTRKLQLRIHGGAEIENLSLRWQRPPPVWRQALRRARHLLHKVRNRSA